MYGFQHPSQFETNCFYQKEFRNFLRAKSSLGKYILTSRINPLIVWRGSWNVEFRGVNSTEDNRLQTTELTCVGIARAFVKSKETVKLETLLRLLKYVDNKDVIIFDNEATERFYRGTQEYNGAGL